MSGSGSTLVLGIESSCDETAAAVVDSGREILSSVVHSQIDEHSEYGGVVPELAGRSHLSKIMPVIDRSLAEAGVSLDDLGAIAVTERPGLVGSLLVGISAAKSLAWSRGLPLIGVHHIEAHAYAATMESEGLEFPLLALIVSGGHTALYRCESFHELTRIASTLDDAAGEAFDKVAWLLGLDYPGGPSISKLAATGDPKAFRFPRYRPKDGSIGFSFSGLKTAVLYHLRGQDALAPTPEPENIERPADVAASFERAVVDALVTQTLAAAKREGLSTVVIGGGVACNRSLREQLRMKAEAENIRVACPSPAYCTDNAAMIAGLGYQLWRAGKVADLELDASPR